MPRDVERRNPSNNFYRALCFYSSIKQAGSRIRTDDLLITNQLLYQLSYAGAIWLRILAYKSALNKLVP